jgi:hypothetical protein
MLVRLRRLPVRLRIAHLAALLRYEREAIARERSLSYPSLPIGSWGEGSKAHMAREGRDE